MEWGHSYNWFCSSISIFHQKGTKMIQRPKLFFKWAWSLQDHHFCLLGPHLSENHPVGTWHLHIIKMHYVACYKLLCGTREMLKASRWGADSSLLLGSMDIWDLMEKYLLFVLVLLVFLKWGFFFFSLWRENGRRGNLRGGKGLSEPLFCFPFSFLVVKFSYARSRVPFLALSHHWSLLPHTVAWLVWKCSGIAACLEVHGGPWVLTKS